MSEVFDAGWILLQNIERLNAYISQISLKWQLRTFLRQKSQVKDNNNKIDECELT